MNDRDRHFANAFWARSRRLTTAVNELAKLVPYMNAIDADSYYRVRAAHSTLAQMEERISTIWEDQQPSKRTG